MTPDKFGFWSEDSSLMRRGFEAAMQALIIYSILCYYLEADLIEAGYIDSAASFFHWNERIVLCLFGAEYLVRWITAKDRWRYPLTTLALIDLVAIVPSVVGLAIGFRSLKLIRTLRILRLFKLYRYNRALQNVMRGFSRVKDELAIIGFVVIVMVLFSSVTIYEFEHEAQPAHFKHLADAVWWSFVTLTTVGYGDMSPVTLGGRMIAVVTMVVGIGIFGTFISLIGSSFMSSMRLNGQGETNDALEVVDDPATVRGPQRVLAPVVRRSAAEEETIRDPAHALRGPRDHARQSEAAASYRRRAG